MQSHMGRIKEEQAPPGHRVRLWQRNPAHQGSGNPPLLHFGHSHSSWKWKNKKQKTTAEMKEKYQHWYLLSLKLSLSVPAPAGKLLSICSDGQSHCLSLQPCCIHLVCAEPHPFPVTYLSVAGGLGASPSCGWRCSAGGPRILLFPTKVQHMPKSCAALRARERDTVQLLHCK